MSSKEEIPNSKNLAIRVDGSCLYMYCDLSKDFGPSSSGKTIVISSSCGNKPLGKSNIVLGLNLFAKSLEKRNLSAARTLVKQDFEEVGAGLGWRVESDGTTLCIRIDFTQVKEKPASSGKSHILASTSGIKPVGQTGISCGLNCYRPDGTTMDVSLISAGVCEQVIQRGEARALADGAEVSCSAGGDEVRVCLPIASCLREKEVASYSFMVEKVQVTLHLKAVSTTKRRKVEAGTRAEGGGMLPSEKIRNLTSVVQVEGEDEGSRTVVLAFNPRLSFGLSSSGKSVTVASSGGFQVVYAPNPNEEEPLCALNFNAYKAEGKVVLRAEEIQKAVQAALADVPEEEVGDVSFKTLKERVLRTLGVAEEDGDRYIPLMKEEVKKAMAKRKAG